MKVYVFFTLNLCAMHGANMYLYNKTQYLKEKGYDVYVYSAEQGEVLITGLKEYQKYQLPHLRFYPACFPKKKVDRLLQCICQEIDAENYTEIIVESTNICSALWGELLAEKLECKHLSFILQERFDFSKIEKSFLRFKLSRNELAGINKVAVSMMLEEDKLPFNESMSIAAYCNNTIDECEDLISPKLKQDTALTIGSIGRLEKKYVLPLVKQLSTYCKDQADKKFNLVFIGGTREKKQISRIKKAFADCNNVNLVLTGALFPIPRSFVDQCDFFISAAGSARATYNCKRPTIFLNPSTGDIIGIVGLTCQKGEYTIYSSNYDITELDSMIELLLKKRNEIQFDEMTNDETYKQAMASEFMRQLKFVDLCIDYQYYNTSEIKFSDKKYCCFNVLGKFVSAQLLYKMLELARKCIK